MAIPKLAPGQRSAAANVAPTIRSKIALRARLGRLWRPFARRLRQPWIGRCNGVLLIGYAEGNLGLGQGFRNNIRAIELSGLPFGIYPFGKGVEMRSIGSFRPDRYDQTHAYDVSVIQVAPDQLPVLWQTVDPRVTRGSYTILGAFWELPKAPEVWRPMLAGIDEIWAPNAFVANAFREIFTGPIVVMRHAVDVDEGPYPTRDALGMDPDRYYFVFSFDYFSSPQRKNPLGVLEAFQSAFPEGTENVGLIIKSIGAPDQYPEIREKIREAAAADRRILDIDRALTRREVLGLIYASNAYVSLHRAEGFGLGMAEAMSFGRIVIGTNFSGNTDFLTEETGFPIPYTLRPVQSHEYPWSEGQNWAEPDLKAAAAAMKLVCQAPDTVRNRAAAGQRFIRENYAPAVVGQLFKDRIDRLMKP
jgi:glycosyltransferase involved in cell wall biosynthesis